MIVKCLFFRLLLRSQFTDSVFSLHVIAVPKLAYRLVVVQLENDVGKFSAMVLLMFCRSVDADVQVGVFY